MISSKEAAGVGETLGFFIGGGGWTVGAILLGPISMHGYWFVQLLITFG